MELFTGKQDSWYTFNSKLYFGSDYTTRNSDTNCEVCGFKLLRFKQSGTLCVAGTSTREYLLQHSPTSGVAVWKLVEVDRKGKAVVVCTARKPEEGKVALILEQLCDEKVTNKVRMQKNSKAFVFRRLGVDIDDADALEDGDDKDSDCADFMTMERKGWLLPSFIVEKNDDVELDPTFLSFLYAMFIIMTRRNEQAVNAP